MTQTKAYQSRRDAEKKWVVGKIIAMETDSKGGFVLDSLHVVTSVQIAKQYANGEPVWVATVEMRPATEAEKIPARKQILRKEYDGLLTMINYGGGWNATDADTLAKIARANEIKAQIGA